MPVRRGALAVDLCWAVGAKSLRLLATVHATRKKASVIRLRSSPHVTFLLLAEHALDPTYAADMGVDLDSLYISQPDSGTPALVWSVGAHDVARVREC